MADEEFRRAIDFSLARGFCPEQSITHFRFAECLHKEGDLPAALEQLSEAEKLFAEMEMTWWGEQAAGLRARIEGASPSCGSRPTWTVRTAPSRQPLWSSRGITFSTPCENDNGTFPTAKRHRRSHTRSLALASVARTDNARR